MLYTTLQHKDSLHLRSVILSKLYVIFPSCYSTPQSLRKSFKVDYYHRHDDGVHVCESAMLCLLSITALT